MSITANKKDIFTRTELLLGAEGLEAMAAARVILFGVGGVGSWCAESLIRSGLGHLTIVDPDTVAASNINRQLMALTSTIGRPKVEVLKERLMDINPWCEIDARQERFNDDTAAFFDLDGYDCIVDCIDSMHQKMLLIELACKSSAAFFSSMGAAVKTDPTLIRVDNFADVRMDPLARMLRKQLRRAGSFPEREFPCVYSLEQIPRPGERTTLGSAAPVTAIFGNTLAALVLRHICGI